MGNEMDANNEQVLGMTGNGKGMGIAAVMDVIKSVAEQAEEESRPFLIVIDKGYRSEEVLGEQLNNVHALFVTEKE